MNVIKNCLISTSKTPLPEKHDGWLRPAVIEKQWYCHNCGKIGHQNSGCESPITSYGIILFYHLSDKSIIEENINIQEWYSNTVSDEDSNALNKNEVVYLLILDRYTPDYAQIMIGNYEIDSTEGIDYLRKLLGRITETEANLLLKNDFRDLFLKYWIYAKKDPTKLYCKQFEKANELFQRLWIGIPIKHKHNEELYKPTNMRYSADDSKVNNPNYSITWNSLIQETAPHWFDPDWGFPKGRRRRRTTSQPQHETDIECAIREFYEETGIDSNQYHILDEIAPIQEDIKGSNGYNYRNIYYLAEAKSLTPIYIDPENSQQSSEVGKIGWYNYERANHLIRPYHSIRLKILHRVHKYLGSLCPYVNT